MSSLPAIIARNVLLQLAEENLADPSLKSKVDRFAASRGIDSVIVTNDGKLLFSSKTRLCLNSGVWTLQKALELRHMPLRLFAYKPLPDGFILNYFSDGYDEKKVYHTIGEQFKRTNVDLILTALYRHRTHAKE